MYSEYPKTVKLKNGGEAVIRNQQPKDKMGLHQFFVDLPERDRMYLKDDVTDLKVIERWFKKLNSQFILPLVVLVDGEIAAAGTLHIPEHGWSCHVGEVRIVVAKKFRKVGIAKILLRELYFLAVKKKLEKISAQTMQNQRRVMRTFRDLGFKREATLKDHVKDIKGDRHDLIILGKVLDEDWSELGDMMGEYRTNFSGIS